MTAALLALLGRLRARWWLLVCVALVVLVLLPFAVVVDALLLGVRELRVVGLLRRRALHCPRGHEVVVFEEGTSWECGACHYTYLGSGLSPCPRCQTTPGYVRCPCGLAVDNPLFDLERGQ